MRRVIAAAFILSALLTGCSQQDDAPEPGSDASSPSTTQSSSSEPQESAPAKPCGKECSGQEVLNERCGQGTPTFVGKEHQVTLNQDIMVVQGTLALRQSDPTACDHIVWVRFSPSTRINEAWRITVKAQGQPVYEEYSVKGRPFIEALTKGTYAPKGTKVSYCVLSAIGKYCKSATT